VVLVAAATVDTDLQNQPSLPRLVTDALMVPALKSRAKITRSLPRPGKSWLHYFFKGHKRRAKVGCRYRGIGAAAVTKQANSEFASGISPRRFSLAFQELKAERAQGAPDASRFQSRSSLISATKSVSTRNVEWRDQ